MSRLKVALIGAGHLGRVHARIMSTLPEFELVAVVDPVETNRREVSEAHGARPCHHFGEVLGRVDAAIIATPTRKHAEVAVQLLRHGVHLLIEKPLAASVAEADELIDLAHKHGAVLQVGHVERFNPALIQALPDCQNPKYLDACRTSTFKFRSTDIGVVLDLMIHDIDVALSLNRSAVTQVDALGVSVFGQFEDVANARLVFENGCVANLNASRASYHAMRRMQVWTDRGFTSIDFGSRAGTTVKPQSQILSREFSPAALTPAEVDRLKDHLFDDLLPIEHFQAPAHDQITAELVDFAESIRHGRQPRVPGEHGRNALQVAERILSSINDHAWDGTRDGRLGPFLHQGQDILRGPHWHLAPSRSNVEHREAG